MPRRRPCWSLSKHRIKLVVAYDGTDFCGWAPQSGQRTVHGTLTEGIRQISGEENEILGASRTDSGAHAKGQVCHFDTAARVPPERWPRILNKILPPDLKVVSATVAPPDFHSRFWADRRWYRYRFLIGHPDPQRSRYTHGVHRALNVESMQRAAHDFVGTHNFLAFSQQLEGEVNTERTLFSVEVKRVRDEIALDVVGTAFVRGMMRRIAGSLLEIGRGRRPENDIPRLLRQTSKANIDYPVVLPACGLTLMKVVYGRHPSDNRRFLPTENSLEDEE